MKIIIKFLIAVTVPLIIAYLFLGGWTAIIKVIVFGFAAQLGFWTAKKVNKWIFS